jgi:uncharacterized delta-60 repeat protein
MSLARGVLIAALILIAAPAAHAATAPGRVVYAVASKIPRADLDATVVDAAVALPDGGAVIVPNDDLTAVRLRADGSLEPSFGSGGIAHIAVPGGVFTALQVLRQPSGRLVVVGYGSDERSSQIPRVVVAGLTDNGALDTAFGGGGFTALDVEPSCGFLACHIAAIGPDGSIVITGAKGQISADANFGAGYASKPDWVVRRLTPSGALDASFGLVKIPGLARNDTSGIAPAIRPTGQIVVLGEHAGVSQLAGLTSAGTPDPAFAGGRLVKVPSSNASDILLHASGKIDVLTMTKIARYATSGALDRSYGKGGVVDLGPVNTGNNLPLVIDGPADATTLHWVPAYDPRKPGTPRLGVLRVSPTGALGRAARLSPAFGGGNASDHGETTGSAAQNSFAGELLARPDGSYLVIGGVRLMRHTGTLRGFSAGYVAVAALTRTLAPDLTFGGPAASPTVKVSLTSQQARSTVALRGVLARVTASGPGLVSIRVNDVRGRILARRTETVFAAGPTTTRVTLTSTGKRLMRRARNLRVRVRYEFRDLLAGRATGDVRAVLR